MSEKKEVRTIDILVFSDWAPDSLHNVIKGLNKLCLTNGMLFSFELREVKPALPLLEKNEWLDPETVRTILKKHHRKNRPLIAITKHRLSLDYFGDTYPDDKIAIVTTYNNHCIPRTILECQYLAYSLVYCTIDLIILPELWHTETRGCLFDKVNVPTDISKGLDKCKLCGSCLSKLKKVLSSKDGILRFIRASFAWIKKGCIHQDESKNNELQKIPFMPKIQTNKKQNNGTAIQKSTNYQHILGTSSKEPLYLSLNRETMVRYLNCRWQLNITETTIDDSTQVSKILVQMTKSIGNQQKFLMPLVEEIVLANHKIDLLYLDIPNKRHRDHAVHQLYVALLGFILMDVAFKILGEKSKSLVVSTKLKKFIANKIDIRENQVDWAWFVTAVLHDHAYPIANILTRTVRLLRGASNISDQDFIRERLLFDLKHYKPLIAKELYDLLFNVLNKNVLRSIPDADNFERQYFDLIEENLSSSIDISKLKKIGHIRYDHGVVGAVNLSLKVGKSANHYFRAVTRAIYYHNLEDEIVLEEDPLSYLLKFTDTIQEWDRMVFIEGGGNIKESECVELGPFKRSKRGLRIVNQIDLKFKFARQELLDTIDWNQEVWRNGTKKHLQLLKNRKEAFINISHMTITYTPRI